MYCYTLPSPNFFIFAEGVPLLLYYSHIPAIAVALLVGTFVLIKNPRGILNRILFAIATLFSLWALGNLVLWTNVNTDVVIFVWSLFGILTASLSVAAVYLVYAFLLKKDVTFAHKIVFALILLPVAILAPTDYNLSGVNLELCGSSGFEGLWYLGYVTALGVLGMLWTLFLFTRSYFLTRDTILKKEIVLMGIGIELFLFSFFFSGFLASYLNDIGITDDYSLEFYGLFGMTFFMVMLAYMIVRFKAFNVGLLGAQALVIALVVLVGSLFTFINDVAPRILIAITLILTSMVGIILIRSVRKEVRQRMEIERLARDLAQANEQQVTLIHFITHQVKGFVTKSRNIFAALKEGDAGPVPRSMQPMIDEGFRSDTQGVATIQEILNAANIRSGKVSYDMKPFDLAKLVGDIAVTLRPNAQAKSLVFTTNLPNSLTITGDHAQLENALKNLIDNSIKYTQRGSVHVSLAKEEGKVVFKVEDSGVGITPEDMQRLFTEGGHGKDSTKVNVESTGFGLYIVKSIIEAHKGKVWAESEGAGKGSRFIIELPA